MVFTKKERELLRRARVGIIGVGGTGGIASEQLVRSGVGNITLADPDIFELTNINRQHFCTISTLGMKKTEAGRRRLLDVNPFLNIKTFPDGITRENVREIVQDLDVIIDASDNKSAHYPLHRVAKELKIPIISRSHRVPDFTFGAEANLWDYRKNGVSTREEDENSKTVSMALEDISEDDFKKKDKLVHREFNRVYKEIFKSNYSHKLLLSENEPPKDFFKEYEESRENLVQGTNWGPIVTMTGTFFATIAINIIIGSKDIFLGPISIKRDVKIPIPIEQKEIR
jgi:hypothetical protein